MHNLNKYRSTCCRTCVWSCDLQLTHGRSTLCDIISNCKVCDNYNRKIARCKCSEEASDTAVCPYYKENKDGKDN